jgi:transposase
VITVTVPNVDGATLVPQVRKHVAPASTVYTDEMGAYKHLAEHGYQHKVINHAEKVYVCGDVHTNSIEGFWSLAKRGIDGVHHSVGSKYLQSYMDEYTFRYNHRNDEVPMFETVLRQIR